MSVWVPVPLFALGTMAGVGMECAQLPPQATPPPPNANEQSENTVRILVAHGLKLLCDMVKRSGWKLQGLA